MSDIYANIVKRVRIKTKISTVSKKDMKKEYSHGGCLIAMFVASVILCFIVFPIGAGLFFITSLIANIQRVIFNRKQKKLDEKVEIVRNEPAMEDLHMNEYVSPKQPASAIKPYVPLKREESATTDVSESFIYRESEDGGEVVFVDNFGAGVNLKISNFLNNNRYLSNKKKVNLIREGESLISWYCENPKVHSYYPFGIKSTHDAVYELKISNTHNISSLPKGTIVIKEVKNVSCEDFIQAERVKQRAKEEEEERKEIARKLKEKQRKRDLEKQVRQELIDSGELFGDKAKRPPIPVDVRDAVYRRDGANV